MKTKVMDVVRGEWGQRFIILFIICVVMAVTDLETLKFFSLANVTNIILRIAVYGIMSCGMLFVVLLGGLDLSVGSTAGMACTLQMLIAEQNGWGATAILKGFAVAMVFCIVVGIVHGFLVTKINMHSFVATLATKYIIYGCIPMLTAGAYIQVPISGVGVITAIGSGKIFGIPIAIIVFFVIALICWFILNKITFGRRIYNIGGNPVASKFVGIKVNMDTTLAFVICSVLAGLAGIVLGSRILQVGQTTAFGYEGYVLMALIVGGINLAGGKGTVAGAVFGALLVGIIDNILTLLNVHPDTTKFVQGAIILGAVIVSVIAENRNRRGLSRKARRALEIARQLEEEENAANATVESVTESVGVSVKDAIDEVAEQGAEEVADETAVEEAGQDLKE